VVRRPQAILEAGEPLMEGGQRGQGLGLAAGGTGGRGGIDARQLHRSPRQDAPPLGHGGHLSTPSPSSARPISPWAAGRSKIPDSPWTQRTGFKGLDSKEVGEQRCDRGDDAVAVLGRSRGGRLGGRTGGGRRERVEDRRGEGDGGRRGPGGGLLADRNVGWGRSRDGGPGFC